MLSNRLAGTLVLALGVFLASPARAQDKPLDSVELNVEVDPNAAIDADKLLNLWSDALKVPILIDPQMVGTKFKLRSQQHMTWAAFKQIADFYDIVIEDREVLGTRILYARLRRNVPATVGPPFPLVAVPDLAAHSGEVVTTVIPIRNGSGNDIFATVRGLLVRDINRMGNILWVRGPDVMILVDFAQNVDYYAKIVSALDVPEHSTPARVFRLEHAAAEDALRQLEPLFHDETTTYTKEGPTTAERTLARIVACPRTNQLIVRGSESEIATAARILAEIDTVDGKAPPRWREATPPWGWKLAALFAAIAFIGQTILLRRFQRSLRTTKLVA
jgi:type II secretory pathway component GspD/PulD (secretin)